MNTSEVLNTAADLIEQHGWTKGAGWPFARRTDPTLCLEGGIMAALGMRPKELSDSALLELWTCPAYVAVGAYLERDVTIEGHTPREALYWWNDRHARTASEVIEVLRAVAVIESARESAAAVGVTA